MGTNDSRIASRRRRQVRVRRKVTGSDSRPRLCVFRSHRFTYAQLVSDESGRVIGGLSTRQVQAEGKSAQSVESAKALGLRMAEIAREKQVESVVFDRNGYLYHGRVAAVAEGAREGGLDF